MGLWLRCADSYAGLKERLYLSSRLCDGNQAGTWRVWLFDLPNQSFNEVLPDNARERGAHTTDIRTMAYYDIKLRDSQPFPSGLARAPS